MTKPDFSKVFAQNGATTALTDEQFLKGFDYLGGNPPTKEEFNWLYQQFCLKLQYLNENGGLNLWQPEHAYALGDICYSRNATSYKFMECIQAGTTAATEPTWPVIGQNVTDGTVTWKVCDIRQGTSINKIPALVDVGGGKPGLPAVSGKLLTDINFGNLLIKNVPLFGPLSAEKTAAYLEGIGATQITLKANTVISFSAGFGDTGPLEHIEKVPTDINLALAAAGINTVPIAYTEDLCVGGTAISGGDYSGRPVSAAFDNDTTNSVWSPNVSGTSTSGSAWIGYNFGNGNSKRIRKMNVFSSTSADAVVASVKAQYSDNGSSWSDTCTFTGLVSGWKSFTIPDVGAHQYWRILANSNPSSGIYWGIHDMEMMEALQTHYLYADRNKTTGAITLGSTKQKPRIADKSDIYTDNLCVGGAAISSGDISGAGYAKENAFDSNLSTSWGGAVGTAFTTRFIGYDFGVARNIRKIGFTTDNRFTTSAKIQKSTDGTAWNDVLTFAPVNGYNELLIPVFSPARYWRVIGNSTTRMDGGTDTAATGLHVTEITMHEIATELLWYSPTENKSRWYDGTTWTDVERVPLGSANVDGAGKIVNISMNPYGLSRIRALPAESVDDVTTLGQFANLLSGNGYQNLPGGLILQWMQTGPVPAGGTTTAVTLPIAFPNVIIGAVATPQGTSQGTIEVISKTTSTITLGEGGGSRSITSGTLIAIGF